MRMLLTYADLLENSERLGTFYITCHLAFNLFIHSINKHFLVCFRMSGPVLGIGLAKIKQKRLQSGGKDSK